MRRSSSEYRNEKQDSAAVSCETTPPRCLAAGSVLGHEGREGLEVRMAVNCNQYSDSHKWNHCNLNLLLFIYDS